MPQPEITRTRTCSCWSDIGFIGTRNKKPAPVNVPGVKAYAWNEAGGYWDLLTVYIAHHTTCAHVDRYKK